jgi:flagellar biosynthesis/type III secretory pathway M-ring protein FliF/YscJ
MRSNDDGIKNSDRLVQGKVNDKMKKRVKDTIDEKPEQSVGVMRLWLQQRKFPPMGQ